ncbi:hypothetical protein M427DRAFT_51581 [Gonapodya prolifera JEL478]|uniref:Uncharacterized protein n=1 Tax=Gonapodya prolifera (strain JEL478) TaxID=1344416 RepID=A0A139AXC1_GONPJ|nr:hypothetical protein M427DRAFT_51581 [Gonapodya prolifera JEL478]|eukprot:KXS21354.1 hypothetical protein M427DRAFT_51581 [Gonapodya prolifera JEL478]
MELPRIRRLSFRKYRHVDISRLLRFESDGKIIQDIMNAESTPLIFIDFSDTRLFRQWGTTEKIYETLHQLRQINRNVTVLPAACEDCGIRGVAAADKDNDEEWDISNPSGVEVKNTVCWHCLNI